MPSLKKKYFLSMYRKNPYKLRSYINTLGRNDTQRNNGTIDIMPYPVEFNANIISKYKDMHISLTKTNCVLKQNCTTDQFSIDDIKWIQSISGLNKKFMDDIKLRLRSCEPNTTINESLACACNFFLVQNHGFKRKEIKYVQQENILIIYYYYSNNNVQHIDITKELFTSFSVDSIQPPSVCLIFDSKPFEEFHQLVDDEKKRGLYAIVKCRLKTPKRHNDDGGDKSVNEAIEKEFAISAE